MDYRNMSATPKTTHTIARDSLLGLEAYARQRKEFRAKVMAHKRDRTVHLGAHVTLVFEDGIYPDLAADKLLSDLKQLFAFKGYPKKAMFPWRAPSK